MSQSASTHVHPYTSEQKAKKLREIDVLVGRGILLSRAIREVGIASSTYYRWLSELRTPKPSIPETSHEMRLRRLEGRIDQLWRVLDDLLISTRSCEGAPT